MDRNGPYLGTPTDLPEPAGGVSVLIADDDAFSRTLLSRRLTLLGYTVIAVGDGRDAWRQLRSPDAPRLAILDWEMPGLDGLEICRRLRRQTDASYTYTILLTARDERKDLIAGMEAGADDYVTKPFDPVELEVRLRAGRRLVDLHRRLAATQAELKRQASTDGLTQLYNRRAILELLHRELRRSHRHGGCVAIILADIDHFKSVNDSYGHDVGDAVLSEVATRLGSGIRDYDGVGRYGGEEFLVVLSPCEPEHGATAAERLRRLVSSPPITVADASVEVTVSFGVAVFAPTSDESAEALIKRADRALYRAKQSGRNRVES